MPHLIRRPRVTRSLATAVASLAAVALMPAAASASVNNCTVNTAGAGKAFASYGDSAWYVAAPDGNFAQGGLGWTLSNAGVQGNDGTFAHSLVIHSGGSAISPAFCVSALTPTLRLFSRALGSGWWALNVYVLWTTPSGTAEMTCIGSVSPQGGWTPSSALGLGADLPTADGSTFSVRLDFIPVSGSGSVAITGVYVDPYSRG